MRFVRTAVIAGVASAAIAGAALAAHDRSQMMLIALPDGSVEHVRYEGATPPQLVLIRDTAPDPFGAAFDPSSAFAEMQRISAAMEAHAAAREVGDGAATAAARAAGAAAASAYTHPLADVHQTKHIVGSAAYAALALELDHGGDPSIGDAEVRWAIEHVPAEVREVLLQMPARQAGKSRLETLLYELDAGIRSQTLPQDA